MKYCDWYDVTGIRESIKVGYEYEIGQAAEIYDSKTGIIEFDISSIGDLFKRNTNEAHLFLTVKEGDLSKDNCLTLYDIQDANENGLISDGDIYERDYIGEICEELHPRDTITIDVTSQVKHDLFDYDQTNFSGFVLEGSQYWEFQIEFYDHTNPLHAPKLIIVDINSESDEDGIPYVDDNCPFHSNPGQEDTYPPQGNDLGDACECEGNLDCDDDQDGLDAFVFKEDFGRSVIGNPCEEGNPCNGDFDCDGDCDGADATLFKSDFGRSPVHPNPCPPCQVGIWCEYP